MLEQDLRISHFYALPAEAKSAPLLKLLSLCPKAWSS